MKTNRNPQKLGGKGSAHLFATKTFDEYFDKLLAKFKQEPQYELKQEFGKMLMRHIDSFTPEEYKRYLELKVLLMAAE